MAKIFKRKAATAAAYQSIHYFFDLYYLRNALEYAEGLIESAAGTTICKTATPGNKAAGIDRSFSFNSGTLPGQNL